MGLATSASSAVLRDDTHAAIAGLPQLKRPGLPLSLFYVASASPCSSHVAIVVIADGR
jgi:hypothetical protein